MFINILNYMMSVLIFGFHILTARVKDVDVGSKNRLLPRRALTSCLAKDARRGRDRACRPKDASAANVRSLQAESRQPNPDCHRVVLLCGMG